MGKLLKPLLGLLLLAASVGWVAFGSRRVDHRAEAEAAVARRDFPAARDHLALYLDSGAADRDAHLLAAGVARRLGDGPAAADHLRRYTELGGDRAAAEVERVLPRIEAGDPSGSGAVYQFCKDHPDHPLVPSALEGLATGMRKIGQPDRAMTCANEWLLRATSPADKAEAHLGRGLALAMKGQAPEAALDYRAALVLVPGHPEARLRLAEFLTRDDPMEALALFRALDAERPDRPEVRLGIARCLRQLGDLAAAGVVIEPLVGTRPDDPDVLTEAGALALDRGRPADAEGLLGRAVEKAPDRRMPNVQLLRCYQEQGKQAEAETIRERLVRIDAELEKKIAAMSGKP
jgi:tetratricopeptide (TPR) repeat protein